MSSIKRKIPRVIFPIIENIVEENYPLISIKIEDNEVLTLYENNPESTFIFKIKKIEKDVIYISKSPSEFKTDELYNYGFKKSGLNEAISIWLNDIKMYSKHSILDDIVLEKYVNDFFGDFVEFQIIDDNARKEPFNLNQQLFLDQYLETTLNKLESYTNIENEELNILKEKISNTRKSLSKDTKEQVMKNVSRIWALAQKSSLNCFKLISSGFFQNIGEHGSNYAITGISSLASKYVPMLGTIINNALQ